MAEIIKMPLLSDTMKEGVIAKWHKKIGDNVKAGDLLAEIETDKATMDLESFFNGTLLHIGGGDGAAITVGDLLAIIGNKDENIQALVAEHANAPASLPTPPAAEVVQQEAPPAISMAMPPQTPPPTVGLPSDDGRLKASPLAKSIAKEKGINLSEVAGSGENGRIVKRDVEEFVPQVKTTPSAPIAAPATGDFTEIPASQMRKTIARRLSESKNGAPHFYLTMEINMDRAVAVRKELNELSPTKISYNDMIIKASALALRKHPSVNVSWLGDRIRYHQAVHIGMAVAIEDGLIVPVIRNADTKGMSVIAQESKVLAEKARERALQPADWEGNTFSISNLGMFGIEEFTAIINPPDACILAVGAILEKPIVRNGEIVVGNMLKVTLSCDHRVVDGVLGSQFLQTLKSLLEEPLKMLI